MGERVFDGLKVIDCASFIAGPAAATVMSDFGAEVIKIEPPGAGDPYRRRATPPIGPGLKSNPGFELDGRNKKSLALDLRSPAGQAVLRRLVARCRCVHHQLSAAGAPPARHHLRRSGAAQRAADLCLVQRLWRDRARGRQARLRRDRVVGAHRADASRARRRGGDAGAVIAGHGRPSLGDGDLWRDRHRALPARAHRQGRLCRLVAAGQWAVGQWLLGAGGAVRREGRAAAAARARRSMRCGCITAAATGAGCCCRSPPTSGAGKSSRNVWGRACSTIRALPRHASREAMRAS